LLVLDNLSPFAGLQSDPPDLLEVGQLDLLDRPDRLDLVDQLDQQDLLEVAGDRPDRWEIPDQILLSMVVQELPSALLDLLEVSIG
jgi:hypothetical protein